MSGLVYLVLSLTILYLALLFAEKKRADADRDKLSHVVYVNGTRGKSSVSRLIDAGLRAGGFKVFCKTTGTLPMTIGVDGVERPINRRGKANIKEQLAIMHQAASQGADILVAECMAVAPDLQYISQHKMVRADIGVITNVRLDHTEEMGETLDEICLSLCSTVPKDGVMFTAESDRAELIAQKTAEMNSRFVQAIPDDKLPQDIDFSENVALALAVCQHLGVSGEAALNGMRNFRRDPYALSLFTLSNGALFINGLSINDPDSSEKVWRMLRQKHDLSNKRLILIINNRPDRGYRTEHMLLLAQRLAPDEVWLMGANRGLMERKLKKFEKQPVIKQFAKASQLPLEQPDADNVIFAAGNIANEGQPLIERVKKEGKPYVS
ncbi:MAG: poly-gamma-glutamate synthase PgsB [Oscillospiraceae bacterium]|nr:poly-gamma-glutamate synthase PgsB [Oscillospiraceae bacterium]MBQ4537979.1 poly-gamma-glutamate synthase PgsB [Oscillospiraceae bacterium]